jgi:hypothetical protein
MPRLGAGAASVYAGHINTNRFTPIKNGNFWDVEKNKEVTPEEAAQQSQRHGGFGYKAAEFIGYGSAAYSSYQAGANGGPVQGAVGGIMAGSAFGPIGMAIGGVLGLVGGIFRHHKKQADPTSYDPLLTPSSPEWSAPGFRPYSAYAGGRAVTGASINSTVNLTMHVYGGNPEEVKSAAHAGVSKALVSDTALSYRRERSLGMKSF